MIIIFVLLILAFTAFYKFAINRYRLRKTKYFLDLYLVWLKTGKCKIDLMEYQQIVKDLVTHAGNGEVYVPVIQEIGYNQAVTYNANPFDGFPNRIEMPAHITIQTLKSCIGIYRSRCNQSLNPFYWFNFLIFLPKNIFEYLGLKGESAFTKISNLIWWSFTTIISGVIVKENSSQIYEFIKNLV